MDGHTNFEQRELSQIERFYNQLILGEDGQKIN